MLLLAAMESNNRRAILVGGRNPINHIERTVMRFRKTPATPEAEAEPETTSEAPVAVLDTRPAPRWRHTFAWPGFSHQYHRWGPDLAEALAGKGYRRIAREMAGWRLWQSEKPPEGGEPLYVLSARIEDDEIVLLFSRIEFLQDFLRQWGLHWAILPPVSSLEKQRSLAESLSA
jgi:hypothetical protein